MDRNTLLKIIKLVSVILICVTVVTFYLFFTQKMNTLMFWVIMGTIALAAYVAIPRARKQLE